MALLSDTQINDINIFYVLTESIQPCNKDFYDEVLKNTR